MSEEAVLYAELYQDKALHWRWRVQSANGDTLADSGQGYKHKQDALHGLSLVTGREPRRWAVREG